MTDAWHDSHGPSRFWVGGRWALELRDDEIADLTFDGRRVLRSVRAVVRDRDWNTATWVVEQIDETSSSLELLVHSKGYGAELRGTVRVDAADDLLVVSFDAVSTTAFDTNRTGLVVLHPPQLAGSPLAVTHSDGSVEASGFPTDISPDQPAYDIAGLEWADDGLEIDVRFTGDVFEMEDQRNWTDASYKTYSRPLSLPFPYALAAGDHVRQSIAVRVTPRAAASIPPDPDRIELTDAGAAFPAVVVGASSAPDPAPVLSPVAPTLLVEIDLSAPSRHAALARAAASARPLDVRLVVDPANPATIEEFVTRLVGLPVVRIGAFDPLTHVTDEDAAAAVRAALAAAGIEVPVVGGARSHFTELSREQGRIAHGLDGVVFSSTPLFHSLTTEQLVEALGMQRLVAEQAVRLAAGAPVHVGPVTLRPRFNDVATVPPPVPADTDLTRGYGPQSADADDERQDAPQLAAWTIASAAALAVPGVSSIAWFEEWGPRGAVRADGSDRPVAAALRGLAGLAGSRLLSSTSPDGSVWAIGAEGADGRTVLVANLDVATRELTIVVDDAEVAASVPAESWLAIASRPADTSIPGP
ncbi:hypothetical protein [Microbacterium sp. 4R-513]|uniref:hypothetical protein n=1 Tax=Microbacterium sp. 4R-513 TaxID=2567934 RepID=UPI0019D044FD|nr:hypothetical protein [Microbacterium sp. 4R-513]